MHDLPTIFTLRFGWTDRTEDLVLQTTAYPPFEWEPPQIMPLGEGPRNPPLHWARVQHQLSIEQAMALVRGIPLFGSVRFRSVVITHYNIWTPQVYYGLFPISGEPEVIFVGIEDRLVHWSQGLGGGPLINLEASKNGSTSTAGIGGGFTCGNSTCRNALLESLDAE